MSDELDPADMIARLIAGSDPLDAGMLDLVDELAALPEPVRPSCPVEPSPSAAAVREARGAALMLAGAHALRALEVIHDRIGDDVTRSYARVALGEVIDIARSAPPEPEEPAIPEASGDLLRYMRGE